MPELQWETVCTQVACSSNVLWSYQYTARRWFDWAAIFKKLLFSFALSRGDLFEYIHAFGFKMLEVWALLNGRDDRSRIAQRIANKSRETCHYRVPFLRVCSFPSAVRSTISS